MHEMSLAMSVMEIARREMERAGKTRLNGLEIEVGEQAGVERETFVAAMRAVTRSETGREVAVRIVDIPARAQCLVCGVRFRPRSFFPRVCPDCGSGQCLVTEGREFRLVSLTCE